MKLMLFFTFLLTFLKGGILICIGVIIKCYFETIISMIVRKPIPTYLIDSDSLKNTNKIIQLIGILVILIGIATIMVGLTTLFTTYQGMSNFNQMVNSSQMGIFQ